MQGERAEQKGYEVTRTSGTAGFTTHRSHADLLFALHENDSLLPNKTGSSLIIPHGKFYFVLYTKHKAKDGDHPIKITTYAPPKPGGALVLNSNAIDAWPILSDFAYIKMLVTLILQQRNEAFQQKGKPQVGHGSIGYELRYIEYARKFYLHKKSFKAFVKAFMNVNSMSLVAYPVGQHHDHFNAGGESLVNKITFVHNGLKGSTGQGGSLFNHGFVFALLDWRYERRTARRWYVTHVEEMGLGLSEPHGAQQILDRCFATADNG